MASNNEAVIAAAGSGKTSYLVKQALMNASSRVLIITYTNENLREINMRLWEAAAGQPSHVETMTLYEFLLRECVKPYQTFKTDIGRIRSVNFISVNPPFAKRSEFEQYYLDRNSNIYSDAVSDLACVLNTASGGEVISRLESIYDKILIDEVQDLAGWDLEFLAVLMNSSIEIVMVGDPRQAVYMTNRSSKYKQFRGANLIKWIDARVKTGQCVKCEHTHSHRCRQEICDFADSLYPELPPTRSENQSTTGHDGVFLVHSSNVELYRTRFAPQELRWDRKNTQASSAAKNFGQVKGMAFQRVLIFPTGPMMKFVEDGASLKDGAVAKFYVAITRARQSVAIVTSKRSTNSSLELWAPG